MYFITVAWSTLCTKFSMFTKVAKDIIWHLSRLVIIIHLTIHLELSQMENKKRIDSWELSAISENNASYGWLSSGVLTSLITK